MKSHSTRWSLLLLVAGIAAGAAYGGSGCSSDDNAITIPPGAGGTSQGGTAGAGAGVGQGGQGGAIFVEHGDVVSLVVEPDAATIEVQNGSSTPATFAAIATFEDDFVSEVPASWRFDRLDLGLIAPTTGVLTAHNALGGTGTVTATVQGMEATASATVVLHLEENSAGLTPGEIALFDLPDSESSGTLVYPYDETVFARDILAPELMWNGGDAGDRYLVHLHQDYVDARFYVAADPPSRFLMSEAEWTALSKSNGGEPLLVDIYRLSGGAAHAAMHQSWTIAQGSLRGTIYYWAVNLGKSMKVSPGSDTAVAVFDAGEATDLGTPAPANYDGTIPPWTVGTGGKRCVSCHTVSKNGERLAGVFERKSSAPSPWGTVDLLASPPSVLQVQPYDSNTLFIALTHDGRLAVQNDQDFTMRLRDSDSGSAIASGIDAYTAVADPAFSGDDSMLAFASNVVGSYPVEYSRADLDLVDFNPTTRVFSNRRQLLAAGQSAVAFPSFSPDNQWVFYQRGDFSRARYGAGNNLTGHNDLYMHDAAGTVGEISLARANGIGVLNAANLQRNYQPNANPIAVGGYYFIVFFSPRDYGNRMVATTDATNDNRKQLWVAAVDMNPTAGSDPSHPAFMLRGQDPTSINMKGYWVLDPCLQDGNSCDAGYECCEGFCRPDENGNFICSPPEGCAEIDEHCDTAADCCDPQAVCVNHFCALPPPQ